MERVVIVMMDTRAAVAAHTRTPSHAQLTFELNRRYACKHGYHLLYLQMRGPTCQHPLLGERHPSTLASIWNLCMLLAKQGNDSAAQELCREAVDGARAALGAAHPDTQAFLGNHGASADR